MRLRKVCPECNTRLHVKRSVCGCGYAFPLKRKVQCNSDSGRLQTMKRRRVLESKEQTLTRRELDRVHKVSTRASETCEQTMCRREQDRVHKVSTRASETCEQTLCRREQDRVHKVSTRASETCEQTLRRQEQNRIHMMSMRASETCEQTLCRQEQNRIHMMSMRASETCEQTLCRQEQNRIHMMSMRVSETPDEMLHRKQSNKEAMINKRKRDVSVEYAIAKFHSSVKLGPNFVCTCCHRMMYRKSVILCNKANYTKANASVLQQVFSDDISYISCDGREWICKTCDRALRRGSMPLQAKVNGLKLCEIPPELSGLNALELRLICLRVPFMKMVALPAGKQRSIHGPAVNVASKVDTICNVLPRLPSQTELVPLKLKRKLAYRGHYMYDYITPEKVMNALRWLKANNPLYADIEINDEWLEQAMSNDEELVASLLEQTDDDSDEHPSTELPTEELCNDSNDNNVNIHDNSEPTIASDNDQAMECDKSIASDQAMECDLPPFSAALNALEKLARDKGFVVRNVPYDGNCMFSAVAHQLQSTGVCNVDSYILREMLCDHLESNSSLYSPFVSQPVASHHAYNADTEPPTDEDAYIDSIADPELQYMLRWERYLKRLRNGAWGDHIAIQGIADMLNISINVLSSLSATVIPIVPRECCAQNELYVGLILQYHYVSLDKIAMTEDPVSTSNVAQTSTPESTQNASTHLTTDTIDDAVFEEGDEHTRQITGGPQASMMSVENPEATVSVAPAEGQKPLLIMTDPHFEAMFNPDKFCYGNGAFSTDRPRKLTYRKYFNQRLLDVDGRFARDLDYLFVAQYIVEAKQVLDDGNNFAWRQKPSRQLTAAQAKDPTFLTQFVRTDKAYSFMKNIRGSPPYYQRTFYDLLAMIRQLGTPTWFFTLSAADLKWPDMIQTIAKQYGVLYTDDDISALSFEEKSNWLRRNPVTAARHFHYRLNTFFQDFLKSTAKPLGEIVDYAIRIEFQARGSPHAHCVIWVKDAPQFDIDDDSKVCDFIDQYISCAVPKEEGKLKELVLLLQQHKHSSYCKRHNTCRFNFPKPPSCNTLITQPNEDEPEVSQAQSILAKVYKILADADNVHLSLDELLVKAEVSLNDYMQALEVSSSGSVVVLKREPSECCINNYNGSVMLAWEANMDLQFVLNAYACVMYVASYIMKTERAMSVLLKQVASEARTEELKFQLRKVGSAFLTHREVSAQEAVYRILSLPLKQLSRSVVFVDTNPKHERIAVLKQSTALSQLNDDDTDVFQKSLIDRYQHRPEQLQSVCLAEFAATYVTKYQQHGDDSECDALPASDSDTTSIQISLTDGFGKMNKRKREAVIRFRRYNMDTEPSNWYRAKLMLYFPWYDEHVDLLGGYETYQEHYTHVKDTVLVNEAEYSQNDVEDMEVDENDPPEHLWDQIAPSTEEHRAQSLAEGNELLTEVSREDLQDNANVLTSGQASSLHVRFEGAANKQEIPADQYRQMLRELNTKQRAIVMFHRNWCKKAVIALKEGKPVEPYHVFLSGPGGVGKSHVIKLIHSDTLKLLKLSGTLQPDDVTVLLTAPTGVAAFNINGMTLHSALLLGRTKYSNFQPLSHDRLNTLRSKLSRLMLVIIDEVSMVGANMLLEVHRRLQQIKGVSDDVTFGGVSILAVGDLYQLPPVGQPHLFSPVSDGYAQLYGSGSLWVDEFQFIELDEVMRQRGDPTFSELLCRVRTNSCTSADISILKSREITQNMSNYPTHTLHVYRLNADVDSHNSLMLNNLAPKNEQCVIKACDAVAGQTTHMSLSNLSDKRSETGGLHSILKLAVGACVMLTANVDVSDGLVNGARGEVVHIITNSQHAVTRVLVKFENSQVGLKAIQSSPFRTQFPNAVPLSKYEVMFYVKGRRGSEVTRSQFPLTLAWATTIHKVQGLTLDDIVIDMKGGRFSPGQAYVAVSRVKTLQGLHILNFNEKAIKKSVDVENEMTRLKSKLLPQPQHATVSNSHVTIALLNVRSIVAKLPDIAQDDSLKCASILCFCETWLTASQPSPIVQPNQIALRCDRASGDNKGGVMISVPQDMHPFDTHCFTSNGIETVTTTLLLSNASLIRVCLVYRSPSVALERFITVLHELLSNISTCNTPCLILGDFNEDVMYQCNSRILSLMSGHGYIQLVQSPTTAKGTLIDQVYCNIPQHNAIVHLQDTYYSDHDTVYCSLPLPTQF